MAHILKMSMIDPMTSWALAYLTCSGLTLAWRSWAIARCFGHNVNGTEFLAANLHIAGSRGCSCKNAHWIQIQVKQFHLFKDSRSDRMRLGFKPIVDCKPGNCQQTTLPGLQGMLGPKALLGACLWLLAQPTQDKLPHAALECYPSYPWTWNHPTDPVQAAIMEVKLQALFQCVNKTRYKRDARGRNKCSNKG